MRNAHPAHRGRPLHSSKSPRNRCDRSGAVERGALSELESFSRQRPDEARSTFESWNERRTRFGCGRRGGIKYVAGNAGGDLSAKSAQRLRTEFTAASSKRSILSRHPRRRTRARESPHHRLTRFRQRSGPDRCRPGRAFALSKRGCFGRTYARGRSGALHLSRRAASESGNVRSRQMHLPGTKPGRRAMKRIGVDPIDVALSEDIGEGDLTTDFFVSKNQQAMARIVARERATLAGTETAAEVFRRVDSAVAITSVKKDGSEINAGESVIELRGQARSILKAERVALNFLQRLSGIATLTRKFVDGAGTDHVTILDTRKTTPGLRALEKAAVVAGGGANHRFGLFDMVLLK